MLIWLEKEGLRLHQTCLAPWSWHITSALCDVSFARGPRLYKWPLWGGSLVRWRCEGERRSKDHAQGPSLDNWVDSGTLCPCWKFRRRCMKTLAPTFSTVSPVSLLENFKANLTGWSKHSSQLLSWLLWLPWFSPGPHFGQLSSRLCLFPCAFRNFPTPEILHWDGALSVCLQGPVSTHSGDLHHVCASALVRAASLQPAFLLCVYKLHPVLLLFPNSPNPQSWSLLTSAASSLALVLCLSFLVPGRTKD